MIINYYFNGVCLPFTRNNYVYIHYNFLKKRITHMHACIISHNNILYISSFELFTTSLIKSNRV